MKIPDAAYMMLKETVLEKCDLSGNLIKRIPSKFFTKFPSLSGKSYSFSLYKFYSNIIYIYNYVHVLVNVSASVSFLTHHGHV